MFKGRIDVDVAARAATDGWIRPGERLIWVAPGRRVHYEVKGRKENGRPMKRSALRVLAWIVLFPVMLIMILFDVDDDVADGVPDGLRHVIARGPHANCRAALIADVTADRSFWVLTDRRFAFLAADPAVGGVRTVWELASDHYVHEAPRSKWFRYAHDGIVFPDGSRLLFLQDTLR